MLSTYGASQILQESGAKQKQGLPPDVSATHENASGSSKDYVTVIVPGVHVLDVSLQRFFSDDINVMSS